MPWGGVGSAFLSRGDFAKKPYHELGSHAQENLFRRGDLRQILEMAGAQEPPNLSVIYAIHGAATHMLAGGEFGPRERRDNLEQVRTQADELATRFADRVV